ncbi:MULTISPECIES: right-handed parallel beta-helix repeat-containing protein [unclassified Wenzhouxiangella]|uniref:right-handed parallel beta-helix repeat-containing protein n=1 Tax=unclassified Wenzhouxiangella TaxID=2613841 RepID=UPI000E327372|nr:MULTISPECIES: right-handed parallel beta-helix repeat-containing protein [unclassified Wenzhouxiangella]RFF27192.1 right-handed parallel beta-helix repeat-containing protein [Wenzhouxiangella sp. 15181]RFP69121.1 right-handed parallel beta-helix repeat-containing protein [Wenzhouxiangella sp. 15190]
MQYQRSILVLILILIVPMASVADSGSYEINQACVEDGCFEGDSSGFPIEISSSGNYSLTSSINVADTDTHAIHILVDNVRLDLGGNTIQGPNVCDMETETCSPGGGGRGIKLADFADRKGIHIANGQIDGFGNYCMSVGFAGYGADLTLSNCFAGTGAGRGAVLERVRSYNNRYGIDITGEAILRHSTSVDNIVNGVQVNTDDRRVIMERNQIHDNGSSGIHANGPLLAKDNFISDNSIGIRLGGDAAGSSLEGNVIRKNSSQGIYISNLNGSAGVAISSNALSGNGSSDTSPQISGPDSTRVIELTPNMCNNSTTCL